MMRLEVSAIRRILAIVISLLSASTLWGQAARLPYRESGGVQTNLPSATVEDLTGDWTFKIMRGDTSDVTLETGASADGAASVKPAPGVQLFSGKMLYYKDQQAFKKKESSFKEAIVWIEDGKIKLWDRIGLTACEATYKAGGTSKGTCSFATIQQGVFEASRKRQK